MSEPALRPPAADGASAPEAAQLGGRLSPAAILLAPLRQLAGLAVVIVAGDVPSTPAVGLCGLVLAAAAVRWARLRWQLADGVLVVEQGLVERRRRAVPLERIQSVELVRSLPHRLLGVVAVQIEVVGGGDQGRLDALSPAVAQRLRTALTAARHGAGTDEAAAPDGNEELLVRLRPRRLIEAGLTGGRVGVAAALLGTAERLFGDRLAEVFARLPGLGTPGVAGLAVAVVGGAFVLGVAATAVTLWDFTLTRAGDELRVRRGLLEQRQETVRLARVQAVRIEQNLLRRPLGLASVRVEVAGQAGSDAAGQTGLVLPIGTLDEALELAGQVLGRASLAGLGLVAAPAAARRRRLVWAVAVGVAAVAAGTVLLGPAGSAAGIAVGALAVVAALDAARGLAWACDDALVAGRAGVVVRRLVVVPEPRVQTLLQWRGPGQRRLGLATLEPQIARTPSSWGGPRLIDLPDRDARGLLVHLAAVSAAARAGADDRADEAPPARPPS